MTSITISCSLTQDVWISSRWVRSWAVSKFNPLTARTFVTPRTPDIQWSEKENNNFFYWNFKKLNVWLINIYLHWSSCLRWKFRVSLRQSNTTSLSPIFICFFLFFCFFTCALSLSTHFAYIKVASLIPKKKVSSRFLFAAHSQKI